MKVIFLFLVLYETIGAQPAVWMRYYDPSGSRDFGRDVIQTFDGGYIFAGNTSAGMALIKTNYLGIIEWQKFILNSNASSIIQTSDSGYVLAGESQSTTMMKLVRTNKFGDTIWSKSYTRNGRQSRAWSGKLTHDKGFILCGEIYPSSPNEVYVVKTDSGGNLQWDGQYNGITTYDIIQSDDGNYYTVGYFKLRKLDSLGKEIWTHPIGAASKILQARDGFLYTGGGLDKFYLAKIDTEGKFLFQKEYFSQAYCRGMCSNTDGDIILSGSKSIDTGTIKENLDVLIAKFDTAGNLTRSKLISLGKNPLVTQDGISNINPTLDHGYIACGTTNYPTGNELFDNILALKTDSLFNTSPLIGITTSYTTVPKEFELKQNFPNPFNPITTIYYSLKIRNSIKLCISDINGKIIKVLINKVQAAGEYKYVFNGMNLGSGIYFVILRTPTDKSVRKMLLLK